MAEICRDEGSNNAQYRRQNEAKLPPPQLKQAIGQDVLAALEQQTGLSQEELLARLSREMPTAVDQYTPDGRLPH
jgi:uncharacterized protein YidB (DUF937 family)